ncbi:quinone oxidoreductase family protein [Pseudonocardia spinosispora]|uniref:quinone oxidoreductase family protein n=1 Tax=Pseudonocardia spinosispora TaxID=103441 RepID=UPI000402B384|nr:zinc-binding dehydrogenase [Pseudonocardia spinosispora]
MRAVVMTEPSDGPDRTEVRDVDEPNPDSGQLTVEVEHAGVNFIDVMARRGDPGYASSWPYVPGLEVAGTVRALGDDVTGFSVGQRVAAFTRGGGLAEVAVADSRLVVPLPERVDTASASAAPLMLATAYLLLTDAGRFRPGDAVLMYSAGGGVGSALAALVPVLGGGRLIGTVTRADKVDAVRQLGWDVVLPLEADMTDAIRAVAPDGVDLILDPTGTRMLDVDLDVAAPSGRIVLFGNAGGGTPDPLPPAGRLIGGNLAIGGFSMSSLTAAAPARAASALGTVLGLLAEGTVRLPITEVGSLDEVAATHQLLAEGRGTGKYVVSVQRTR